jgi:hypothetical protein
MVTKRTDSLTSQHGGSVAPARRSNGELAALARDAVGPCRQERFERRWPCLLRRRSRVRAASDIPPGPFGRGGEQAALAAQSVDVVRNLHAAIVPRPMAPQN